MIVTAANSEKDRFTEALGNYKKYRV